MRHRWVLIAVLLGTLLAGCDVAAGLHADLRDNSTVGMPSGNYGPAQVRDQGSRGTCQTFAAVAALEAAYKREMGLELDLSEEFTNYLGKTFWLRYDLYGASLPLSAAATETQLAAWSGGNGVGWLKSMSHGFAVPVDSVMPYRSTYSLTPYCGEGCDLGTRVYSVFASIQRNVDDFNLNPANLPLSALSADAYYSVRSYEVINARDPAAFERVLDQGYEIVWDFDVAGYRGSDSRGPIWRPMSFRAEATLTRGEGDGDALPEVPVSAILEVRQEDTDYEEDVDWEKEGNEVHWLGPDRPEAGSNYTVEYRHENDIGSHAMLIIGYEPGLHYFLVKNSWGKDNTADLDADGEPDGWTLVSYDYVRHYGRAASYITEVNPPRTWLELAFVGRWNLSMDGEHSGMLDIYHLPGIMQKDLDDAYARDPVEYPGANATDRRLGVYYDASGQAFRVNGSVEGNHLTFYIDEAHPDLAIDQISGRRFDFFYVGGDPGSGAMAGVYLDTDGGYKGGYALRYRSWHTWPVSDRLWSDNRFFDSPRPLTPESWLGRWTVSPGGELVITGRDDSLLAGEHGVAGLTGTWEGAEGIQSVTLRVDLDDPSLLYLEVPSAPGRRVVLRHLSQGTGVAAGGYMGSPEESFGVLMRREGPPFVAQIVSPTPGMLSRAQTIAFDVDVTHDPAWSIRRYGWGVFRVNDRGPEWPWQPVDGMGSDEKTFSLMGSLFEPGGVRYQVRVYVVGVTAADDVEYEARDEIEIWFPANAPPTVEILSPEDGATFFQHQTIELTGKSFDADHPPDFQLDRDELSWYLGSSTSPFDHGHTATLSGLSVGSHKIAFYGTDGWDSDSDSITIQILPDPVDLAPEAHITSPAHGAFFTADSQDGDGQWYVNVTLEGEGFDPEDRELAGASLEWSDSVNGGPAQVIGTGSTLTVPLAAPNTFGNTHTITLTVRDSHGHTATATITITVSQFS